MSDVPENKVDQVDVVSVGEGDLFAVPRDPTTDASRENVFVCAVETGGTRSCGSILFSAVIGVLFAGWLVLPDAVSETVGAILVVALLVGGVVWLTSRTGRSIEYDDAVLTLDEPPVTGGRLRGELYTGIPVTVHPDGFVAAIECNRQTTETTQVTTSISKSVTTTENAWSGVQQVAGPDTVPADASDPAESVWGFTVEFDLPDDVPPTSRSPEDPEGESEDAIVWTLSVSADGRPPNWYVSWEVPVVGALDGEGTGTGDSARIATRAEDAVDSAPPRSSEDPSGSATAKGFDDAEEPAPLTASEEGEATGDEPDAGERAEDDAASDHPDADASPDGESPDSGGDDPWIQPPVRKERPGD